MSYTVPEPKIFACTQSKALGEAIARAYGADLDLPGMAVMYHTPTMMTPSMAPQRSVSANHLPWPLRAAERVLVISD